MEEFEEESESRGGMTTLKVFFFFFGVLYIVEAQSRHNKNDLFPHCSIAHYWN